uniref:RBR-type E3 ubiquitin transferase n=1 Tax=Helicotheca tamesis TaxID=374047 RepID=A0A7S2IJU9_9STRA|mmetsp:Transcript_9942/g.13916  ORF Transcript_9942/g.13916 Transcript_9942/m.13916 type:complete len:586 (+) Transcript_9942:82-1839(+)|eukprot:CAMPEP_0185729916 /NCGR_PEP_ID=MMETSP1171-20130828/7752_1 /TAXON_ID=374046 /ORGANISM="Helicotheca tamensis, Strain CCMP826" /LENGTH=585 /DNA_ID=CAMNT_0028398859 /DNA_START=6 /DNA_END=1763 /DNA_ORIENTATION=-
MNYSIHEDPEEYIYSSAEEDDEMSDEHDISNYYGNCNNSDFGENLSDEDDLDEALYSCHYFQNQENECPEEEDSDDDFYTYSSSEPKDNLMSIPQKRVRMVIWSDLQPTMKQQLFEVVEVLGIPSSAASVLMREFRWSKEQLLEEFTNNPDRVKTLCGVYNRCNTKKTSEQPSARRSYSKYSIYSRPSTPEKMRFCEICFEDGGFAPEDMISMPCGHEFCRDCWRGFANNMVREGTSCLNYTCPQVGCNEKVTEVEIKKAAPQLLPAYKKHQLKAFVDTNMYSRWCPGIGCERVAVGNPLLSVSEKVSCSDCDTMFCFKCGEEPHSPMTCHDLIRWKDKCKDESETAKWITVYTKVCPKCKTRIEKNGGCNHMTCRKCNHEFCWICMKNWKGHSNCNAFVSADDDPLKMADTKRDLERYVHYYERYQAHGIAQKLSEEARKTFIDEKLGQDVETNQFLKNAHDQLVECRRILKYTYAFAYLNMNNTSSPSSSSNEVEKRTFEYHQGMLERFTENLSELCEAKLEEIDSQEVINLTRVLQDFAENVLTHVEESVGNYSPSDSTTSRLKQFKLSSVSLAKNLLQRDP